jgi:hypothetical protein
MYQPKIKLKFKRKHKKFIRYAAMDYQIDNLPIQSIASYYC